MRSAVFFSLLIAHTSLFGCVPRRFHNTSSTAELGMTEERQLALYLTATPEIQFSDWKHFGPGPFGGFVLDNEALQRLEAFEASCASQPGSAVFQATGVCENNSQPRESLCIRKGGTQHFGPVRASCHEFGRSGIHTARLVASTKDFQELISIEGATSSLGEWNAHPGLAKFRIAPALPATVEALETLKARGGLSTGTWVEMITECNLCFTSIHAFNAPGAQLPPFRDRIIAAANPLRSPELKGQRYVEEREKRLVALRRLRGRLGDLDLSPQWDFSQTRGDQKAVFEQTVHRVLDSLGVPAPLRLQLRVPQRNTDAPHVEVPGPYFNRHAIVIPEDAFDQTTIAHEFGHLVYRAARPQHSELLKLLDELNTILEHLKKSDPQAGESARRELASIMGTRTPRPSIALSFSLEEVSADTMAVLLARNPRAMSEAATGRTDVTEADLRARDFSIPRNLEQIPEKIDDYSIYSPVRSQIWSVGYSRFQNNLPELGRRVLRGLVLAEERVIMLDYSELGYKDRNQQVLEVLEPELNR